MKAMMKGAALAALVLAHATMPVAAQDKMALTPGSVEQIDLAAKLTNYGVARNDPILLLAAARVLATLDKEAAEAAAPMSARELAAKAKELAGADAALGKLADTVSEESARGLCHGPGTYYGCF